MRRILGFIMIMVGLLGIALSIFGIIVGNQLVDGIGESLHGNLTLTLESLETVQETLLVTRGTLVEVNEGLVTVEETADSAARAIDNLRPLISQVTEITSEEVPASIETIQGTIPSMVQVATAIDDTLTTLNSLRVIGIGVEYEPEIPFGETVAMLGTSLEGIPIQLRTLEVYFDTTDENLSTISRDISGMSDSLQEVNTSLAEFEPLLDEYMTTVTETLESTRETRAVLDQQIAMSKIVITVFMAWLGLTQAAPLYLGYELLTEGRRPDLDVVVIEDND